MTGTAVLFLAFVAAVALAVMAVLAARLGLRAALVAGSALALWFAWVGTLAAAGVVRNPALRPPGIVYVVGPLVLFVFLGAVRSRRGGAIARAIPLALLIGFQTYRVGVELFLHALWREGLVPQMLTWNGANLDLWIGCSAPLVTAVATRGPVGRRIAAGWTVAGLVSLANVVVRSALTTPGPLHLLASEIPNRAIGIFPYTYIAGFLAPLAMTLHVLALRHLAARTYADLRPAGVPA